MMRRWSSIADRQVFGLAGDILLAHASQSEEDQCNHWAFVPAYRCGAVPESHRVPY
jgi:hypothetical protein